MKDFKYDVIELIQLIRDRPCLWDKSIENYKDRVERRSAWEEIFNELEKNYENMSQEEKRVTGEYILNKWTNVRDTFVKSLKNKLGNKQKKKYLYYKQLEFLIKVVPKEDISEEYTNCTNATDYQEVTLKQEESDDVNEESSGYNVRKRSKINYGDADEDSAIYEVKKKFKKSSSYVENDTKNAEVAYAPCAVDFVGVDESDPRVMNEDEAFFASLLPTVVKYDEDERLEFRIEVLNVMKKIKDKRNWPGTSCD